MRYIKYSYDKESQRVGTDFTKVEAGMIKIDGKQYDVPITELGLDVEFQYKFAEKK